MSNDFFERRRKNSLEKETKPQPKKSFHSAINQIHIDVYGQPTKDVDNTYFSNQLNKISMLTGEENFEKHHAELITKFMENNRDNNEAKFANFCTIDMMTNSYSLSNTWPMIIKGLGLERPKKFEKPTEEYFGIEVHPLYIILNSGLAQTKVMKSKCHSITKDGKTYYYPKDNRLRSQYDYESLRQFLNLQKEYDFGQIPEIEGSYCYGFHVCRTYPQNCSYKCGKFKKLKYLFKASEIPHKYCVPLTYTESPELKNSDNMIINVLNDIKDNIIEYVESGESFVFYSTQPGTGKTSWACTIAKYYIFRKMPTNMLTPEAVYVNVSEYFSTLKSAMGLKDDKLNTEILQLNNLIKDVPLLVFDDLGTEKPSDYVRDTLYQVINYRYANKLSTIFTTNLLLDSEEAEQHLGKRIISRLQEATIIDFDGEVK